MSNGDKEKLAKLVLKAKGDRSLRQYAMDANMSPSIISRIINGSYQPGIKVLQRLVSEEAKPCGGVTLEQLAIASGFASEIATATTTIAKDVLNASRELIIGPIGILSGLATYAGTKIIQKRASTVDPAEENEDVLFQCAKRQKKFKSSAWGIIRDTMSEKGIKWMPGRAEADGYAVKPDDFVFLDDEPIHDWWFVFWAKDSRMDSTEVISNEDWISVLIGRFISLPADSSRKLTLVLDSKEHYEAACLLKERNSYKGNLSVMLIDTENVRIVDEEELAYFNSNDKRTVHLLEKGVAEK